MANFGTTGLLAAAQNQRNGVALNFSLPPDATPADGSWRLFEFKAGQDAPVAERFMNIHSAWLFGKDRRLESTDASEAVCFIYLDHPSISRQHALIVFRKIGENSIPYLLDLKSSNGTSLNGENLEPGKLTEIFDKDVFKFAASSREWVMLRVK